MGNGLLIFARPNCDADRLFHGALLSTANYLLIVISAEERSVMEQLPTSGSGGTVTAIIAIVVIDTTGVSNMIITAIAAVAPVMRVEQRDARRFLR